mmetsp:Transcript_36861/g.68678  ORF Transcript_36861/g.68678 Transcript_36861/m.68678 type:complete len:403 (+) Transcript_36861:147-1355(+)
MTRMASDGPPRHRWAKEASERQTSGCHIKEGQFVHHFLLELSRHAKEPHWLVLAFRHGDVVVLHPFFPKRDSLPLPLVLLIHIASVFGHAALHRPLTWARPHHHIPVGSDGDDVPGLGDVCARCPFHRDPDVRCLERNASRICRKVDVEEITSAPLRVVVVSVSLGHKIDTAACAVLLRPEALIDEDGLAVVLPVWVGRVKSVRPDHNVLIAILSGGDDWLLHPVNLHRTSLTVVVPNVSDVYVGLARLWTWADSDVLPVTGVDSIHPKPRLMVPIFVDGIQPGAIARVVVHPVDARIVSACSQAGTLVYLRGANAAERPARLRGGALRKKVRPVLDFDQSFLRLGRQLHEHATARPAIRCAVVTFSAGLGACRDRQGDHGQLSQERRHLATVSNGRKAPRA